MTQPISIQGRPGGMRRATITLLALAGLLAACGGGQAAPSDPDPSTGDVVGDWVLTGGSIDGGDAPVLPDHRITMTITGSRINGTAACNGYGGEITMGADGLHLENLGQTAMACEDPAMAAEAAYMAALSRVREIVRDGDDLVARGDGVELRFEALAPPPTAELIEHDLGARDGARRGRRSRADGGAGDARAERGRDIHRLDRLPHLLR